MENSMNSDTPKIVEASMDQLKNIFVNNISMDDIPIPETWSGWFSYQILSWLVYAAKDPWGFAGSIMIIVCPLFIISGICSWKLAQLIQKEENDKKRRDRRGANLTKVKRHTKAD